MANSLEEFKQKVKESNDIVSVVSKYVTLNRKGKTWWANCPFHYEKTPSFAVNEQEQYYHCFGCGVSGDIFNFVQHLESCEFMDALKILADNAGLKIPEFGSDIKNEALKKEKEQLYNVLRDAALYYYHNLNLPQAEPAIKYIQKRKLNNDAVKAFAIGYSLGWNEVVDYLKKKGYSLDIMQKAGIVEQKDGRYYDVYAKRLIFPLINTNDNVVGFSARILDDGNYAKYRNTAETPVFEKNNMVYGLNLVKKLKRTEALNEIIIVEGQIDVISLYRNGVKNAVACLGTALTPNHAKQLKRYCDKVVVCFDGDGAGKKATLRSLDILVGAGLDVYVLNMPVGVDPDEYVLKFGAEEYLKLISNAKYWVEYLIGEYASQFNLSKAEGRSNFVITALNVIKKLPSLSEQNVYLEMVKGLTNISMDVLRRDLEDIDNAKATKETVSDQSENALSTTRENAYVKAVKFVMAALLHKKDYATLQSDIKENLLDSDIQKIYEYIETCKQNGTKPVISHLFDMFDVENNPVINDIINYNFTQANDNEVGFNDCVKVLVVSGLNIKQTELHNKFNETKDLTERREITKQLSQVVKKLNDIKNKK